MSYYYGIDLGTTNSSISRFDGTETRIIKGKQQSEITPSVVNISKNGRTTVGSNAYNALVTDSENTICEFKRWMGRPNKILFKNSGIEKSPEELSSEILKSLISDVYIQTGERIKQAVVTVPIEFGQLQCDATVKAGQLAGLEKVILLQEPISASIAYGYKIETEKNKVWMVYDFGGGTFDSAVVSTQDDQLTVIGHAGDNLLGGKDIDNDLVDKILIPILSQKYELSNFNMQSLKKKLLHLAEQCKIELSYSEDSIISIYDVGSDANGEIIEEDIKVVRNMLNDIVKPYVDKSIELCNNALYEARVTRESLDAIVLVGGTTFVNYIRERLTKEYEVHLKYDLDPMTVVALGASIFALKVADNGVVFNTNLNETVSVNLYYDNICIDETTELIGNIENNSSNIIEVKIESTSGIWNSGWVPLNDKKFVIMLLLEEKKQNIFTIYFRDLRGNIINSNINSFSITHTGMDISNPPLPHSIGLEIDTENDNTAMDFVFPRSTKLPCDKDIIYKASRNLKRTDYGEFIGINLFEGDSNIPSLNESIGLIKIKAEDLNIPLRENDEIELHIEINESRQIYIEAKITSSNQYFSWNVYVPEQKEIEVEINKNLNELNEEFRNIENNIDDDLFNENPNYIEDYQDKIDNIYIKSSEIIELGDINSKQKIYEEIKSLRKELNKILENNSKQESNNYYESLKQSQNEVNGFVEEYGTQEDINCLKRINKKIEINMNKKNDKLLMKNENDMWELWRKIAYKRFDYWEYWYRRLRSTDTNQIININKFNELIDYGDKALENEDLDSMRIIVNEMNNLIKKSTNSNDELKKFKTGLKK